MNHTSFATIQFIDSHSESIPHKNLIVLDGMPLWMYNAVGARGIKKHFDEEASDEGIYVVGNYICTNYGDDIIPDTEFGEKIPRANIDVGKCKLANRVADAVRYLKEAPKTKYVDAFVLLLGNVRSRATKNTIGNAMKRWCQLKKMGMDITGMLTVTNYNMYGPGRAISVSRFGEAKSVIHIGDKATEEKEQESEFSWFFDGGVMIMDSGNYLPAFKNAGGDYEWLQFGDTEHKFSTQFPYLGDSVYAIKTLPGESVELDAAWQLPLMMNVSKIEADTELLHHMDRQEEFKACKYMT